MKKTTLLAITALTICFVSCRKNQTNPQQPDSETTTAKHFEIGNDYKYSKEIRVFNPSNKDCYVDVEIKSNTSVIFENLCQYYNSCVMELVTIEPTIENSSIVGDSKNAINNENTSTQNEPAKSENLVYFKNYKKGKAKGFKIISTTPYNPNEKTDTYVAGFSYSLEYIIGSGCNYYTVYAYNVRGISGFDFYWNGSSWVYVQNLSCPFHNTVTFSGVGYLPRKFYGSSSDQNCSVEITIY